MKRIWIIPVVIKILILAPLAVFAQLSLEHHQDQWIFGINAGLLYQGSDIPDLHTGWGGGITLGKTLYQKPGTPLAFDLRGRVLLGTTYGQDHIPYQDVASNDALNGERQTPTSVDYSESPLVFTNNKTQIGELGMEGVVRFNRLLEKRNVHLAIFGGIGLDWYKTKTDQLDGQALYDYENWSINNKNRNTVLADLKKHQDRHYETMADGFNSNFGRIGLMPSLGIELGYQFTPGFALVGGHRVSFAGTDVLDGVQYTGQNDKYHYTSLGLQWTIKKDREKKLPPNVRITYPDANPSYMDYPDISLLATVERIDKSRDIQVYLNGRQVKYFQYSRGRLQVNMTLRHGRNEVMIVASNEAGTDRAKQTIFFEETIIGFEPEIRFLFPVENKIETSQKAMDIRLKVRHVDHRNGIHVWVNGREDNEFRFDPNTGQIDIRQILAPGINHIQATAVNDLGKATAQREIVFVRQVIPIAITWHSPAEPYSETTEQEAQLIATISGIQFSEQIELLINDRIYSQFSFDPSTGRFRTEVPLSLGDNTVILKARNEVSEDQSVRTIFRNNNYIPTPLPIVDIDQIKQLGQEERITISARILHVDRKVQINLVVNDKQTAFEFDPFTGRLNAKSPAKVGRNRILIRAWNNNGKAEDTDYFDLLKKIKPPVVSFQQPSNQVVTIPNNDYRVIANIQNIESSSQIKVRVNGNIFRQFDFDSRNGKLVFSPILLDGENLINVVASNRVGLDEGIRKILVKKEELPAPARLEITFPAERYHKVTHSKVTVLVQTSQINSYDELRITLNDRTIKEFRFDSQTGRVSVPIDLNEGNNRFQITAPAHNLRDERIIFYDKPIAPPTVRITKPGANAEVSMSSIYVNASLSGIDRKDQIRITHDNIPITVFEFTGKKYLKIPLILKPGVNQIQVRVTNKGGQAQDKRKIIYRLPATQLENNKPEISNLAVSQPTVSPFDPDNARSRVTATIVNTHEKGDILLVVNGEKIETFDFAKGRFSALFNVKNGRNTIRLTVSNRSGTDTENRTLNFTGPDKKPTKSESDKESGPKRHS